jgi:hypothetical protein
MERATAAAVVEVGGARATLLVLSNASDDDDVVVVVDVGRVVLVTATMDESAPAVGEEVSMARGATTVSSAVVEPSGRIPF